MSSSNCKSCSKPIIETSELAKCFNCKCEYHFNCAGFTEGAFRKLSKDKKNNWKCAACYKSDDAKIKTRSISTTEATPEPNLTTLLQNLKQELKDFITQSVDQLGDKLSKSIEFNSEVIQDLKQSITDLKASNQSLREKCDQIAAENIEIKKEVKELQSSIIELKQYSRRCNIEVSNLPECENENMATILTKIDELSNTAIMENLVVAHRIPTFNKANPKSIIIQVKSKPARDEILKKLKNRKLMASNINNRFPDNMPIYANEHLTPELKRLFSQARKFKIENNFKFCWTRDGKIFLRKDESSSILRIHTIEDLSV